MKGILRYCVTHANPLLPSSWYDKKICLGDFEKESDLHVSNLSIFWHESRPLCYGAAGSYCIPLAVKKASNKIKIIEISSFRKKILSSEIGKASQTYEGMRELTFSEAFSFGSELVNSESAFKNEFLVASPYVFPPNAPTILDQYSIAHHKNDIIDYVNIAVKYGFIDGKSAVDFLDSRCIIPGGCELGIFPKNWLIDTLSKLEILGREFLRLYGSRITEYDSYQIRCIGFLSERLGSFLLQKELSKRFNGKTPPSVYGHMTTIIQSGQSYHIGYTNIDSNHINSIYKDNSHIQERIESPDASFFNNTSYVLGASASNNIRIKSQEKCKKLVSICIPVYNGEEYLADALRSVNAQTYPQIEILLSDDGSTDRTLQIAEEMLKDSPFPVRILRHEQLGLVGNWNYCISEAKGKYIKFLFQDDLLDPNCVSELLKVAERNSEVGLVFSPRNVIQDDGKKPDIFHSGIIVLHKSWSFLKSIQPGKHLLEDPRLFIEPLNKIGEPTTVLIRRDAFELLGGFDENLRQLVDVEMWMRIMTKFNIGFVDKMLSTFRVHQKQATKTNFKEGLILTDFKKFFTKLNISPIYSNLPENNKRNAAFILQRLGGPIPLDNFGVPKISKISDQKNYEFEGVGHSKLFEETSSSSIIDKASVPPPSVIPLADFNKRPFWSIMIPAYNPKPEYLNKVLRSVLTALPKGVDAQIEILDDASPNCDVAALLKKMAGITKVSVHRNTNNLGYIANWNACIERARGEWVHILHQDDYVLPGFYEKISAGLKLHPEAGAAFCRHNHVSAKDETTFTSALERAEPGILENWPDRLSSMQRMQFVSTVVRRSTFEKVGGFWSEARSAADWEMWMRIASAVPVFFHPEVLACFRIHNISESSRLLMSGENSTDTCRAIDLFSQYLPEVKRTQLVAVAKNHYARSAFGLALSFLQQKQFAAASAQVNAALELEPTVQNEQIAQEIRNQIPAAVLNESTPDASNAVQPQSLVNFFDQEEVDNIQHLVTAFQAAPVDDSSQKPLRDLRKGLADYLLGAQPSDLKSLMGGSYGKVFELILNSGLQDESLTSEESNFADSLVGGFDGEGQFDVRRLMSSMLFWRAHRTAALLAVELIPSWFFESYINYLIFSPEAFQEIGEAELYRKYIHNVLSEFWRRIEESPRSPLSLKLSQIVASRLNLIPLYFNEQGNKDTYILRSKFIGHFLESRGLKLAETGQKASSARKRIKVGFLNAHFTSQTETYTTIPTFSHLDRSKFEVILYCLGSSGGPLENFCRNCADSFVVLPQALDEQIKRIRGDKLDALVIGTNVTAVTNQAALLASARLAPVQLINNSSPVTSGMPHVDGYLSGTFLVDEKSGEEYSEKLCLLDGPSHCFNYEVDRREPVVKLDRAGLGIPQDAVVYFSGANCFKIIPEMQEAWARILAKVPGSVLLLHPFNPNWASNYPVLRFERNMLAAFARHGVEANRLVLSRERLPSRSDVLELIKLSDIYLDSFPFAGVNSAVDPLEVGIPLVACEMQTFRSRMAGSLLRELKIEELIATGEQDYIDLATKLGLDSSYRAEVSQKIVSAMGGNPRFLDSAAYSVNMGRIIESLVGRSLPEAMPKNGDFTIQDAQTAFSEGRLSDAEDICREILGKDERSAGAWHLMGKMAALQGDLETAGEFVSVACDLDPENADFVRESAEVFFQKKELEGAEQQVRRVLEMAPDSPEGLVLLGRILAEKDNKHASLEAFQDALRLRKDYAEGFSHYATALQKFARGKDAISQIRKACALEPGSVEFQTNLAILLEQNARYVDALAAYGKAARMNPNVGFVWFRQGKLLNGLKRYSEAIPILEKAISLPGQLGDYHYEYGLALHMSKRFQEALVHYEKALSMGYETAALHCNRGVIYKDLRKGGDSIMAFHKAVTMDPSNVSYLNNLGAAALELGLNSEALDCFEQAVEKNPKLPTARNNIGNLLKDRARGMDALPQYRKSMELNPDDRDAPSNYLLCHMYIPDMDPKLVFEEHKKWGISTTKKFPPAFKFKPREAGAKIRMGFLSADLCHHPVAHFIEPIFRGYDRERFEFVAYGDQRKSDEFSARFAKQVDLWRETSSYDDRALAKLIHEDRVDILFELAGHTAYNRLGVFALKPAPVQVSYLGYPGTTGLPTIDFRITDAFADPQGTTEHLHTEKLIRVPECAWCFEPDASAPEVEPLPALKNGFVTFGCFNNMAKLNPALFETWAEILLRVPGSHLRLKARTLTDDGVRKELKSYFTERGIEEDRLDFFGHTKKIADHLNHYHSVDIALDSFPYHGTTTTCEAMWMGCPVVTRAGKTHVSRVGVSLLTAVGLQEFITDTREAYIEKAVALAGQTDRLEELRAGMRDRMRQSVLMDEKRFVQGFEKALMEMANLGGLMRS